MRRWWSDGAFRAIVRNASYLGSGNLVSALLGLLALACAGRGLSPTLFGTLVVVQAYAKTVSDIAKFQTWQFVVQFGTPALARTDHDRFRDVVGFSFGLDLASGLVALLAGMALLPLLGHAVGIQPDDFWWALAYCTLIPTMTAATPTGILRAIDRFDLIAVQQAITPLLRAIGSVIAYFAHLGFPGFIATWYVSSLVGDVALWLFAVRELRRQNIPHALRPGLLGPARRLTGAWSFVWTTNFAHSIWSARNAGSNVLVGIVLGPAAAGLFKVAQTFFDAAGTPASLMQKSFYPEIMRLDPASTRPWKLGLHTAMLAGGLGVLVALLLSLVGEPVIAYVFGAQYTEAYNLLRIMSVALVVSMASFPLESLLYVAGKQRAALVAQALAAAVYALLLIGMSHAFGITGAAIAYVCGQCLEAIFCLIPTLIAYRKRQASASSFWPPEDEEETSGPAWQTFPPKTLQRLFDAVDVDDVVDPHVVLPDPIVLACPEGTGARCYALCLQFWEEGAARNDLLRLVEKLLDNAWLSAEERLQFKHSRATFKHLRFAQRLYSRGHRSSFLFNLTTVWLGHFQDAFRSVRRWDMVRRGLMLRVLLSKPVWAMTRRSMRRTRIDSEEGIVAFQKAEMRRLKAAIDRETFAGEQFHVVRKIISMQVSYYDTLRSLEPDDDHARRMSRFLAAINGRMGARHDEMVAEDLLGRRPYETPVPLGKETRAALETLLARYPF
jgi:O-antigen/teichoic acid export membrane protein